MIDELHFYVDRELDASCITVTVETGGIRATLRIETPDPTMSAWSAEAIEDFGNEVNEVMGRVMADFHRMRNAISRNAQLEAVGLEPDFSEMFRYHEETYGEDDTTEQEAVA